MRLSPNWLLEFIDLKIGDDQLAQDLTQAGIAVESIELMDGQTVFQMEIGTNRPDAMCQFGVAREASAIYDLPLRSIRPKLPEVRPAAKPFPIEIQDPSGCGRYTGRVIRNVHIGSSHPSIRARLKIEDHHGINNVVDASNYTLMEMGHPTHAFDLDKLAGGKIVVRRARPGEMLTTLDGVERKLDLEDLIIADAVKPVGLAGVMGGLDSAISDSTKNILIESAWFDPATVRKTARRLGMHTDASHIFERGADWGAAGLANNRVAELVLTRAGGELEGELVDAIARRIPRHALLLRRDEVLRILGQVIPDQEIVRILSRLGFAVSSHDSKELKALVAKAHDVPAEFRETILANADKKAWIVDPPTWRLDVEREIDLIEEIARIYGYNKFANTLPAFGQGVVELQHAAKETKVRSTLLALGYNEAISPTFVSPGDASAFSSAVQVPLANPISDEQSIMRTSLVSGMLGMLAWNLNRGNTDVRLFEMGNVFSASSEETTQERRRICLGATGTAIDTGVHGGARPLSFFDVKGDVETLLRSFELQGLHFGPGKQESLGRYYREGRSAVARGSGTILARFGQIDLSAVSRFKIRQDVYVAEIFLDDLFKNPLRVARYQPLSRYPAVDRDFSFVFSDSVIFARIHSAVQALNISELQSFKPVEIFRGGAVPAGKYSVLLRARFQSVERTLRDDEVASWSAQIIKVLEGIGGSLRS